MNEDNKILKINEKYGLKADSLNYILVENKPVQDENSKNFGKENWVSVAWVSDLKGALKYLVDKEVREVDLFDVKNIIEAIDNLKEDINKLHFRMT